MKAPKNLPSLPAAPRKTATWSAPHWTDEAMMQRIAERLRAGNSQVACSRAEGMPDTIVATWMSRALDEAVTIMEARERGEVVEPSEFLCAVAPLARARGEWAIEAEQRAIAGDPGYMWAVPRRLQGQWSAKEGIAVEVVDSSKAVAALLSKLTEGGDK